jgi:hypothetical protein
VIAVLFSDAGIFLIIWILTKGKAQAYDQLIYLLLQILLLVGLNYLFNRIYYAIFPPKKTLLVYERPDDTIVTRVRRYQSDSYDIVKTEKFDEFRRNYDEIGQYDCLIAVGLYPDQKNELAKECYQRRRSLYIVPMLNPDGVAIRHFGADAAGLFKKRVIAMNGNHNFSLWQANARGVDLNHNYDAEFEQCKKAERALGIISGGPTRYGGDYPESEPESGALVHLTRILSPTLKAVLALHTQGEEIYWDFAGDAPKNARMLAECFSRVSGYTVASPPAEASYGGYKDFVIREFRIPAFTIECGRGKNPLPSSDFYAIYDRVLPILLTAAAF